MGTVRTGAGNLGHHVDVRDLLATELGTTFTGEGEDERLVPGRGVLHLASLESRGMSGVHSRFN